RGLVANSPTLYKKEATTHLDNSLFFIEGNAQVIIETSFSTISSYFLAPQFKSSI
ncbi:hypothetical protein IWX83_002355, partial [Flavobacterium sp. CG_9.1]|nr:hypothetical protein [Flavobacterium sp. CG_9.1]